MIRLFRRRAPTLGGRVPLPFGERLGEGNSSHPPKSPLWQGGGGEGRGTVLYLRHGRYTNLLSGEADINPTDVAFEVGVHCFNTSIHIIKSLGNSGYHFF